MTRPQTWGTYQNSFVKTYHLRCQNWSKSLSNLRHFFRVAAVIYSSAVQKKHWETALKESRVYILPVCCPRYLRKSERIMKKSQPWDCNQQPWNYVLYSLNYTNEWIKQTGMGSRTWNQAQLFQMTFHLMEWTDPNRLLPILFDNLWLSIFNKQNLQRMPKLPAEINQRAMCQR